MPYGVCSTNKKRWIHAGVTYLIQGEEPLKRSLEGRCRDLVSRMAKVIVWEAYVVHFDVL